MKNFLIRPFLFASFTLIAVLLVSGCRKEPIHVSAENDYPADQNQEYMAAAADSFTMGYQMLGPEEYNKLPRVNVESLPKLNGADGVSERGSGWILNTPSVAYQGAEASCVAFSIGYAAISYYLKVLRGMSYSNSSALRSPEFLYNTTKLPGSCNTAGTNPRYALNFLMDKGVCSWSDMPYNDGNCTQQPSSSQWQKAFNARISGWSTVSRNASVMISLLDRGYPIIAGFQMNSSFRAQTDVWPYIWKTNYGASQGGHAVLIVGYDNSRQAFIVQNSWGTAKHDRGYFYLSYNMLSQLGSSLELFVINGLK